MIFKKTLLLAAVLLAAFLAGCDDSPPPAATASPSAEAEQTATAPTPEPIAAEPTEPVAEPLIEDEAVVVATVNGTPISRRTLTGQMMMAESGRMAMGGDESRSEDEQKAAAKELEIEILNSLINLELACQEAVKRGYAPTETEITAAMEEFMAGLGDSDQVSHILDQFGETEDSLKGQLAKNLALQKWQENDFLAQSKVTDKEAKDFYDAHPNLVQHGDLVKVSQILVAIPLGSPGQSKEEAKAKAEKALGRLKNGDDFTVVAAEMSSDPEAARTKGDLGWLGKGQYLPMFEETLFKMKPGEISEIIESPLGFHIFKVYGVKPAGQEPFESVKVDIVEFLSNGKLMEAVRKKMLELQSQADIQVLDPKLKEAYEAYQAAEAAAIAATEEPAAEGKSESTPKQAAPSKAESAPKQAAPSKPESTPKPAAQSKTDETSK